MNIRALIGVAGVAALAFGSAANAIKIDDEYSVTYAKETLRKAVSTGDATTHTVSGTTYYVLEPSHMIAGPADVTANADDGDDYEVIFTLDNMVFSAAPTLSHTTDGTAATFQLSRGGAVEDNFAVFVKSGGGAIGATEMLTLAAEFAITGDGPGGITRMISNEALPSSLPGIMVSMTHENADAVKVVRALKETVVAANPMADAGDSFMSFTGGSNTASVGTLTIGVESGIRDARVGSDSDTSDPVDTTMVSLLTPTAADGTALGNNDGNTGIIAEGTLTTATATAGTAVTFDGDYSFVETLAVGSDCTGTLSEIRKMDEDDRTVLLDETMPQAAGAFAAGLSLCIAVDGETPIPSTDPYTVTTEYKGPALNMFPPVGDTHDLGSIRRSGSTYRIPYLTTNARHNQRITIVNRGAASTYELGELMTVGDSVSATDAAMGDLPAGQTVLEVSDLIEVTGAARASGTLSMPADPTSLDVSIDIINRETGAADTVYLSSE